MIKRKYAPYFFFLFNSYSAKNLITFINREKYHFNKIVLNKLSILIFFIWIYNKTVTGIQ